MSDRGVGVRFLGRREFLAGIGALGVAGASRAASAAPEGELLYNGIQLPAQWPPRVPDPGAAGEPMPVPYLAAPPAVIPIDVGRQLFVDDFLIQSTTLRRTYHTVEFYSGNPVLRPDKPWEKTGKTPTAMAFSDGAWYDPQDRLFKLWYMGGEGISTCYATSHDGIHWEKPSLDVRPGTNIVMPFPRDSGIVWLDLEEKDPTRRFKATRAYSMGERWGLYVYTSPDGIHWSEAARSGSCGDRSTVFYNPFRKVWVFSLRHGWGRPRRRRYREHPDLIAGAKSWERVDEPQWWVGSDRLDLPRADMNVTPELYNLDCVAYESLMLGFFTIWRGQNESRPKPNEVCLGFSRDGFHWSRPDRRGFIPVSERRDDWNWGNVQSVGGGCVVVGDKLYFYCSGRQLGKNPGEKGENCTGLAMLRRDGFASMEAGMAEGTLTTRPVSFTGSHLWVNADASAGELRAEIVDGAGKPVPPFTRSNCRPVRADSTAQRVTWKGAKDLAAVAGRPAQIRFYVRGGSLYSFWIAREA